MSRRVLSALSVMVIFVAGCGDSTSPDSVAGVYHLETFDGHPLPYESYASDDGLYRFVTQSEVLTLNADRTFSYTFQGRSTDPSGTRDESDTYTGTWTLKDNALTLVFPEEEFALVATLNGKTITIRDADTGLLGVFRKE